MKKNVFKLYGDCFKNDQRNHVVSLFLMRMTCMTTLLEENFHWNLNFAIGKPLNPTSTRTIETLDLSQR